MVTQAVTSQYPPAGVRDDAHVMFWSWDEESHEFRPVGEAHDGRVKGPEWLVELVLRRVPKFDPEQLMDTFTGPSVIASVVAPLEYVSELRSRQP